MDGLIEALEIFRKYANEDRPTHCEHDILMVVGVEKDQPSEAHRDRLDQLGFFWDTEYDCWASFKYGSA